MLFRITLVVVLLLASLALSASDVQSGNTAVSVVYFHPRDATSNLSVLEVDILIQDIQIWYKDQVGQTFTLQSAQIVRGQRTTAEYIDGGVWVPILTELGYFCGTGIHVIIVHTSLPSAGGGSCDPVYSSGERGGTALVSEANFPANCDVMLWWCGFGGLAHDLGHTFTLPHPSCSWECSNTVMLAHWLYPDVGLLDLAEAPEITTLQNSTWFGASPEPTPAPCEPKFNPHGKRVGRCKA